MSAFGRIYDVAATGMAAQRLRVQLIAANVANSETTRTPAGGPYRKKDAVFEVASLGKALDGTDFLGVRVKEVRSSADPFSTRFEPGHPDANPEGMVLYPNVNPVLEMVDLTEASRSYEANVAVVRSVRSMSQAALDLLRVQATA
ncbi:MAG: flagellar basal body rod protein FlgC [Acidobacteria bacterium]|nr:flagellar basal body rod protein FlgC [Acidobacteriota bacterium]